ncbi:MAG TPA: sulfatase [Sphingobacteriaceae bacterium]|nr:sulfatase [Sphingobacteriaceae bacterium]
MLIICFLSAFTVFKNPKAKETPNIILIVADDHGTDAIGCYGNPVIKTPNLDRLAAEGTRFTNAFCTTASCSPSRSVILSGMQSHTNGMYGLEHSIHHFKSFDNLRSLPVVLAENGYRTGRVGKFHIAPEDVYKFQTALSAGTANDPASLGRNALEMAEISKGFISEKNTKPFFLYFATDDPHRSNTILPNGKPDFNANPGANPFGNRKEGYKGITENEYTPKQVIVPSFLPDNRQCREELAQYYQSVSRLDQGIGRLIQILKETGKYENTVIMYISDNGVAFPGAKTTLYDPGIRLPCIVRDPAQTTKSVVNQAMVSWVDITPTILDFAGITTSKEKYHGRSFKNILPQKNPQGWDDIYASHSLHEITMYYPMRVVRTRNHKLIYNIAHELQFPMALDLQESYTWKSIVQNKNPFFGKRKIADFLHRPEFELYDLKKDPNEIINVAKNPDYKKVYNELLVKLKNFQENTNDPWFHKWEYE